MNEWVSVQNKLPLFEEKVLLRIVINEMIFIMLGWNCDKENKEESFVYMQPPYEWRDDGIEFTMDAIVFNPIEKSVSHWMSLPEPPK